MRVEFVALLVLFVALAGCFGDDDDIDGDPTQETGPERVDGEPFYKPAEMTELEQQLNAIEIVDRNETEWDRPNVTRDEWLLLSVPTDEAGHVAAFKLEIPKDILTAKSELFLDVAVALGPMGEPEGLPEGMDWLFMMMVEQFNEEWAEWESYTTGSWVETGYTRTQQVDRVGGDSSQDVRSPQSSPFRQRMVYDEEIHGDSIYFILAARGPSDGEFGMGIRFLEEKTSSSTNWAAFEENLEEDQAPLVPERVASASGLFMAVYSENHVAGQSNTRTFSTDAPTPDESLSEAVYPYMSTRSVSFNMGTDWGGWSDFSVLYATGVEYGEMEVDIDLHGAEAQRSWTFFGQFVPDGVTPLFEPPIARMMVEGGSPSSVDIEITKSGTLVSESLSIRQYSIGLSLEEVTGLKFRDVVNVN